MKKLYTLILLLCCTSAALSAQKTADEYFKAYEQLMSENKEVESLIPLRKAADLGHAEAQYLVGIFYYSDKSNSKEALAWFMKSAEGGYADAQFQLALMYDVGKDIEGDSEKAIFWYNKATAQGSIDSQLNLGIIYAEQENWTDAFKYFKLVADQGDRKAQYYLYKLYDDSKGAVIDSTLAFEYLKKAAEQNLDIAQCDLGCCYYWGRYIKQDHAEAVTWLHKAALQNNGASQLMLGMAYSEGLGVQANINSAVYWITKSVESGFVSAERLIAKLYFMPNFNDLTEAEKVEGFKLVSKLAKHGSSETLFYLGLMHLNGKGTPVNVEKGVKYITQSAESGYPEAQYYLGQMYAHGDNITADKQVAIKWLELAVEQDHKDAQKALGDIYFNSNLDAFKELYKEDGKNLDPYVQLKIANSYLHGDGVAKNIEEGLKWLTWAADNGHVTAQCSLGSRYEKGENGITKDYAKAFKYYTLAAEQGFSEAQYRLGLMYEQGLGCTKSIANAKIWYKKAAAQYHGAAMAKLKKLK